MIPLEHQNEPTAETTRGEPYLLLSGSHLPSSSSLCSLFCRRLCLALANDGGLKHGVLLVSWSNSWSNVKFGPCKPGSGKPVSSKPGLRKPGPGTPGQWRGFISKRCCCTAARMVRSKKLGVRRERRGWGSREQKEHMGSLRCIFTKVYINDIE